MDKYAAIAILACSSIGFTDAAIPNGGKYSYLAIKGGDYDADGYNAAGFNIWGFNRDMVDQWGREITDPMSGLVDPAGQFIDEPIEAPVEDGADNSEDGSEDGSGDDSSSVEGADGEGDDDDDDDSTGEGEGDDDDDDDSHHPHAQESLPFPPDVISTPYYTPLWGEDHEDANPSITPSFCDGGFVEFEVKGALDYEMAAWYLFDICSLLSLSQEGFHVENMYVHNGTVTQTPTTTHILVDYCKAEDLQTIETAALLTPETIAGAGLNTNKVTIQPAHESGSWAIIPVSCPLADKNMAYVRGGKCLPCPVQPGCDQPRCTSDGHPICNQHHCSPVGYAYDGTTCQPCNSFYAGSGANVTFPLISSDLGMGCPANLRVCQQQPVFIPNPAHNTTNMMNPSHGLPINGSDVAAYQCDIPTNVPGFFCNLGFGPTELTNATFHETTMFSSNTEWTNQNVNATISVCTMCSDSIDYDINCENREESFPPIYANAQCNGIRVELTGNTTYNQCLRDNCDAGFSNQQAYISSKCVMNII